MFKTSLPLGLIPLFVLSGCTTFTHPSASERKASIAEAVAGLKQEVLEHVSKSTFQVINSASPFTFEFTANGSDFHYEIQLASKTATGSAALATAISKDGYLLSAAHVARPYVAVIGWMDGAVRMKFARVVYKKYFGTFGAEIAVLHVEATLDSPLALHDRDAKQAKVYAFVRNFENDSTLAVVAGHIFHVTTSELEPQIAVAGTDLTTWRGDSGGGVMSPDGYLIGVTTGYKFALEGARLVCMPSPQFIEGIVGNDRADLSNKKTRTDAH